MADRHVPRVDRVTIVPLVVVVVIVAVLGLTILVGEVSRYINDDRDADGYTWLYAFMVITAMVASGVAVNESYEDHLAIGEMVKTCNKALHQSLEKP